VRFTYTHPVKERLMVKLVGKGDGFVKSSPRGVTCGLGCSHLFHYGSTVKLTATAADGSRFAGWSGACRGHRTCAVRMKAPRVVKARFVKR
jgi:hypothetical protein